MKPFLKWPGSKGRLLPQLVPLLPDMSNVHTYIEPFLGSGAMFFALEFDSTDCVMLADTNEALIDAYRALRDMPNTVIKFLQAFADAHAKHPAACYADVRDRFNNPATSALTAQRAAMLLYLNRTCFNGIWRVNAAGKFNVPMGDYKNPTICDTDRLLAASDVLKSNGVVRIRCTDFVVSVIESPATLPRETFVYLDPPYVPVSGTSDFTGYTAEKFDNVDLTRLRSLCCKIDALGGKFMLSNSDAPSVRDVFRQFDITEISRQGNINSDASKRGAVTELVVRNYA